MCRLSVFSGMLDTVELACALTELELAQGGHGNGLFIPSTNKIHRGTTLSVVAIAREAAKKEGMMLFHTRLSSCGGIKDELCHPFYAEGDAGKFVVSQNGHWGDWRKHRLGEEQSDTQAVSMLVAKYGIGVLRSEAMAHSGVWIAYDCTDKSMYVVRRSGEFFLMRLTPFDKVEHTFFHASQATTNLLPYQKCKALIQEDQVFRFLDNGKVRQNTGKFEVVEPAVTQTTTTYYCGDGMWGSTHGTQGFRKWLHDRGVGADGNDWMCFCKEDDKSKNVVYCKECAAHWSEYNMSPLYTDEWKDVPINELREVALEDFEEFVLWAKEQDKIDEAKTLAEAGVETIDSRRDAAILAIDEDGVTFACWEPACNGRARYFYCGGCNGGDQWEEPLDHSLRLDEGEPSQSEWDEVVAVAWGDRKVEKEVSDGQEQADVSAGRS